MTNVVMINPEIIGRHFDMNGFADWVSRARPGERVAYYTGELVRAVDATNDDGTKKEPETVGLAGLAYRLHGEGRVCLTQMRLGASKFIYLATKCGLVNPEGAKAA